MNSFLESNNSFEPNSWEHFIAVLIFTVLGIAFIYLGSLQKDKSAKRRLLLYFTFGIFLAQLGKVTILIAIGEFDLTKDLPFHLCNIAPFILWLAYYLRSRVLWGVIFLWIMAGTFQANFTPNLTQSFPHFEWFRYWIIHTWLIIAIIYGIIHLDYRMKWLDPIRSLLWLNVFAAIMYPVNLALDANYLFLIHKPDAATLFSILGDWPYYIFQLEFVALALFYVIYLPFYLNHRRVAQKQVIQ
jgi:hypothetical integral membrane protein (TIGR02206 family)